MASIYDWSISPGDNATADSQINFAEGQQASTVNDSARQLMGRVRELLNDIGGALEATGSANAISVTAASGVSAYVDGIIVTFRASAKNTGPATFNLNAIGAKTIRMFTASGEKTLSGGEIQAGGVYTFFYSTGVNEGDGGWVIANPTLKVAAGRPSAVLSKVYAYNGGGVQPTYGAWTTLPLDTEVLDPGGLVTLSSNQFTLSRDGVVEWNAEVFFRITGTDSGGNYLTFGTRLYNVTDSTEVSKGWPVRGQRLGSASGSPGYPAVSKGRAEVIGGKVYRVEYYAYRDSTQDAIFMSLGLGTPAVGSQRSLIVDYWAD